MLSYICEVSEVKRDECKIGLKDKGLFIVDSNIKHVLQLVGPTDLVKITMSADGIITNIRKKIKSKRNLALSQGLEPPKGTGRRAERGKLDLKLSIFELLLRHSSPETKIEDIIQAQKKVEEELFKDLL